MNYKGFRMRGRGLLLRYYLGFRQKEMRKTTTNLSQNSQSLGRDFEPGTSRIRSRNVNHWTMKFHCAGLPRGQRDNRCRKYL
jgi:hypothetical protein